MFIWNHEDWLIAYPEGLQPTQWNCPAADKTSRDGYVGAVNVNVNWV
jgi:hypothetical protein